MGRMEVKKMEENKNAAENVSAENTSEEVKEEKKPAAEEAPKEVNPEPPHAEPKQAAHPGAEKVPPVNGTHHFSIRWDLIGKLCVAAIFCGVCGFGGGMIANYTGAGERQHETSSSDAREFFSQLPGWGSSGGQYVLPDQGGSDAEDDSRSLSETPALGVTVQQISNQEGYEDGVYVMAISDGSKAAEAGLEVGDRIVKADDQEISENTDLSGYIAKKDVGDRITLTVERDGEEKTVEVELVSKASLTTDDNKAA